MAEELTAAAPVETPKVQRDALASTLTVRAELAAGLLPIAAAQFPQDPPKLWAEKAVEYADVLIEALNGPS